ncbi:hypothetical protein T492DRAFT_1142068 [Pavlovales sp. CCMP2436]|nr:hypothetical protein T492DRAFT_1142068 [Pavlovales sp. CCMP2436]
MQSVRTLILLAAALASSRGLAVRPAARAIARARATRTASAMMHTADEGVNLSSARLLLLGRVMAMLDTNSDGFVDKLELYKFTKQHSPAYAKRGYLETDDVRLILTAKRLTSATRTEAQPLLLELLGESPDGRITIAALMRMPDAQLRLLEQAGNEAQLTGYIPPELCATEVDDAWERRVIAESRRDAGGMNAAQADILANAIKWGF